MVVELMNLDNFSICTFEEILDTIFIATDTNKNGIITWVGKVFLIPFLLSQQHWSL